MSSRKSARGYAALRPDDEPEWLDDSEVEMFSGLQTADKKTTQLCRQVEEAVSCALVCSTSPILRDLLVIAVEALRGAAMLQVLVTTEGESLDCHQTEEALRRARGYIRHEVARAIHRKRVPSLSFVLVPDGSVLEVVDE